MNISEDNMFKMGYTSVLSKNINNKRRWTSLISLIKKYKIMITTIIIFLIAFSFNFVLLYNFFRILERIN